MRVFIVVVLSLVVYSPLVAFSVLHARSIREKEKTWVCVVRAALPLLTLAFIWTGVIPILTELAMPQPLFEQMLTDFIGDLIGVAVSVLLCFDCIRSQSKTVKVFGILGLLTGLLSIFVILAQG